MERNVGQVLPDNKSCSLLPLREKVGVARMRGQSLVNPSPAQWASSPARGEEIRGFTLIELLVVVLIIGILAAVALPQYQKAVLKSRYSTLMPIAKSLAMGNEAYYMEKGQYATSPTQLDVAGQTGYPDGTTVNIVNDTSKDMSYVIASRPQLMPNNKHIVFQKHSGKFADVTLCEATADAQATWLCKDALHGQAISGNSLSGSGWTAYVLSGDATGSSFASALEQQAATLLAQNSNYAVGSIDEEKGTITMCDTSKSTVGSNGECVPTSGGGGVWCSIYTECNNMNSYEVTYDTNGNVIGKTSCSTLAQDGSSCISWNYVEKDSDGLVNYSLHTVKSPDWGTYNDIAARAIYENGVYVGYHIIQTDIDGSNPYHFRSDSNGQSVGGSVYCTNGVDWENAQCL